MLGYLGMSDALTAFTGTSGTGSGAAAYLPFNGVYEGDQNVINGSYYYWGIECLYGNPTEGGNTSSSGYIVGSALKSGIVNALGLGNPNGGSINDTTKAAGTCTGDVSSNAKQSILLPLTSMAVERGTDGGFPSPGAAN
jgi:hypothetical protein